MWPFGGKISGSGGHVPAGRVMSLSSQGIPETEIIRMLRNEGYTPADVDTAMKQALRGAVSGAQPASQPGAPLQEQPAQPASQPGAPLQEQPAQPVPYSREVPGPPVPSQPLEAPPVSGTPPPGAPPGLAMPPLPGEPGFEFSEPGLPAPPTSPGAAGEGFIQGLSEPATRDDVREDKRRAIEELAEGIVEEKWSEFKSDIGGIQAQLGDLQARISALEQSAHNAGAEKKSEFDTIDTKIDTYKQSMGDVSSRMEAMENAMKDTMTPMMQTLRSLSDAVKSLKKEE